MVCVGCLRELLKNPEQRAGYAHLRDDPYFYWYLHDDAYGPDPYGPEDFALFEDQRQGDFGDHVDDGWAGT
jgi:hypothetical protein